MPTPYAKQVEEDITVSQAMISKDVADGFKIVDAINRNCHTAETYAAALKLYNLKPVIPD